MRARVAALAMGVVVALVPGTARAAVDPTGFLCGYDKPKGGGPYHASLDAGPLLLVDGNDPATIHEGTVTCTLQDDLLHSDTDVVSVTSARTAGAVVLPSTTVWVPHTVWFLCTEMHLDDDTVLYYDWTWENEGWSTDPGAECEPIIIEEPPPPMDWTLVDSVICPILVLLLPPDGDVGDVWNCPPY